MNEEVLEIPISKKNLALEKEQHKCVSCGYCVRTCKNDISVYKMYDIKKTKQPICIHCGQCANICPTEAIHERFDYLRVKKLLKDKKKILAFSIAPAVRVALGEEFGLPVGTNVEGKIVSALKQIGANYVFDINFGADLTIMEEAMELVHRIEKNKKLPMFTSCCPAWVNFCEIFYPKLIPNLSTCKSPISMQSTIINRYFTKINKINKWDIINIVVAPCTAKKYEITRDELIDKAQDCDFILTTRELAMLLKEYKIDLKNLKNRKFDNPFGLASTSGMIFGSTGGVMEAALRTAYYFMTKKNLKKKDLKFNELEGMKGIKEASIVINDREIKVCVINGMKNAKTILDKVINKEVNYDFIEVMNCLGGCVSGGGQPKITLLDMTETRTKRMNALYSEEEKHELRLCHENPYIKELYKNLLLEPNSQIARDLLHTTYSNKSDLLEGNDE